ncbi:hypothetical protein [Croceicoccus sediminis]|uniref:hypothetical protein n=1 Tax=Croceicoccus sediminis TaxID=2571150 RepID=UPI001181E9B7|nr:hypothetical protein [Croceicoccus sediminis]
MGNAGLDRGAPKRTKDEGTNPMMQNAAISMPARTGRMKFRSAMIRRPIFGRRRESALPMEGEAAKGLLSKFSSQDVKDFLMAYSACFIAVMCMIA